MPSRRARKHRHNKRTYTNAHHHAARDAAIKLDPRSAYAQPSCLVVQSKHIHTAVSEKDQLDDAVSEASTRTEELSESSSPSLQGQIDGAGSETSSDTDDLTSSKSPLQESEHNKTICEASSENGNLDDASAPFVHDKEAGNHNDLEEEAGNHNDSGRPATPGQYSQRLDVLSDSECSCEEEEPYSSAYVGHGKQLDEADQHQEQHEQVADQDSSQLALYTHSAGSDQQASLFAESEQIEQHASTTVTDATEVVVECTQIMIDHVPTTDYLALAAIDRDANSEASTDIITDAEEEEEEEEEEDEDDDLDTSQIPVDFVEAANSPGKYIALAEEGYSPLSGLRGIDRRTALEALVKPLYAALCDVDVSLPEHRPRASSVLDVRMDTIEPSHDEYLKYALLAYGNMKGCAVVWRADMEEFVNYSYGDGSFKQWRSHPTSARYREPAGRSPLRQIYSVEEGFSEDEDEESPKSDAGFDPGTPGNISAPVFGDPSIDWATNYTWLERWDEDEPTEYDLARWARNESQHKGPTVVAELVAAQRAAQRDTCDVGGFLETAEVDCADQHLAPEYGAEDDSPGESDEEEHRCFEHLSLERDQQVSANESSCEGTIHRPAPEHESATCATESDCSSSDTAVESVTEAGESSELQPSAAFEEPQSNSIDHSQKPALHDGSLSIEDHLDPLCTLSPALDPLSQHKPQEDEILIPGVWLDQDYSSLEAESSTSSQTVGIDLDSCVESQEQVIDIDKDDDNENENEAYDCPAFLPIDIDARCAATSATGDLKAAEDPAHHRENPIYYVPDPDSEAKLHDILDEEDVLEAQQPVHAQAQPLNSHVAQQLSNTTTYAVPTGLKKRLWPTPFETLRRACTLRKPDQGDCTHTSHKDGGPNKHQRSSLRLKLQKFGKKVKAMILS